MEGKGDVTLKDLYERYQECRDLELKKFWEYSKFVWCFFLLCFGAFGMVLMKYLEIKEKYMMPKYEIVLAIISFLGIVISQTWVWMARGLKTWFEVFEIATWDLETKYNVFGLSRKFTINNYWGSKSQEFYNRLSPTKIVILIGHILTIMWILSFWVWLFFYFGCTFNCKNSINWYFILCSITPILIWLGYLRIKSSVLRNKQEEDVFQEIRMDPYIQSLNVFYEVKDEEVIFYTKTQKQKCKIIDHYPITPNSNSFGEKLCYDIESMKHCCAPMEKTNEWANKISKKFVNNQITPQKIKIFNKIIYAYFKGNDYVNDNLKISKTVNELMNDYYSVKVNYELTK